jgi:predicted GIY-YIG superfamily endonuclease
MFKITSRFYIIYGNDRPIYVGYTNRTVKQRFSEHCKDKDFSNYDNVYVKELTDEKLSFNFTWDYEQTCLNAKEVSERESYLVSKYDTQDTCYQKAIGGGQTWASEKYFVKSNVNNPKFMGMTSSQIKKYLESRKKDAVWLSSFVSSMKPVEAVWLNSFVSSMMPVEAVWLNSFVGSMKPAEAAWLSNFVHDMRPVEAVWLSSFVSSMMPAEAVWLHNFVNHMKPVEAVWLNHFVSNMKPVEAVWLHSFVSHMKPVEAVWLSHFVDNMRPVEAVWLSSFVGNMR